METLPMSYTEMKFPVILLSAALALPLASLPARAETVSVNADKLCSVVVGIPYASDNFTDKEWQEFLQCKHFLKSFSE